MFSLSTFNADVIVEAHGIAACFELWCCKRVVPRSVEGERCRVVVADLVLNAAVAYKFFDFIIEGRRIGDFDLTSG